MFIYRRRWRNLLTPLRRCSAAVTRRVSRAEAAVFCWLRMARSRRLLHSCLGRARGVAASQGTALAGRPGRQTGQAAIGRRDGRTNQAASAVREQAAFAVEQ